MAKANPVTDTKPATTTPADGQNPPVVKEKPKASEPGVKYTTQSGLTVRDYR